MSSHMLAKSFLPISMSSTSQYCCLLHKLEKPLPTTTLYYKAGTNHVPVLLCSRQLAQTTSHYYTGHFPVPQCTTKFAPKKSQYYFVLPSSPNYLSLLLCPSKLAQTTSEFYFVLQSLQATFSSTLHEGCSVM